MVRACLSFTLSFDMNFWLETQLIHGPQFAIRGSTIDLIAEESSFGPKCGGSTVYIWSSAVRTFGLLIELQLLGLIFKNLEEKAIGVKRRGNKRWGIEDGRKIRIFE
ncbi:hypothetical protein HAX54_000095 [Datura stramonium]|uniref:Uncharacterized protein n=1 Tax=Datura stramonium TaxID=4076 RepID=A0ABS8RJT7_DATST|nr:hypothetical protein [Datura stramonium]